MLRFLRTVVVLAAATGCYGSHGEAADGDATIDARVDTDASSDAADAADTPPPPWPVRFVLRFVSDVPGEELFVAAWDAAYSGGHWLSLFHDGSPFSKSDNCGICPCDDCPGCPVCGPPCMEATHLAAGSSVEYPWDGRRWMSATCPSSPPAMCERVENGPAGAYTARFCWGTAVSGMMPCDEDILNIECQDVPFTLPDPDGLVEYTINWGG